MLNLSLKELDLQAKTRAIKGYKSMPIDKLLIIFNASKLIKKTKENVDDMKILEDIEPSFESNKNY